MSEEKMRRALESIAKGCPNPRQVALEALGIGRGSTVIIQLCEATILCTSIATCLATFNEGLPSASKPMSCCDDHKKLCQEEADQRRLTVSFAPIAPTQSKPWDGTLPDRDNGLDG